MSAQGSLLAGKYRLVEPLGRGAMGVVWSAVNAMTEREVAIKLLANAADEQIRIRLMREARACGRIQHPNVIEIFDVGATETKEPFLVMQRLRGETLGELIQREKTLELPFAIRVLRDVARGLTAAHKADVVHRDLKPANVFLHREPEALEPVVKLLDFGVSRISTEETMTLKGIAIGSPAYMAPEQAMGQRVDVRTDLWTFGTLTFFVLSGRLPFNGKAPVEYLTAVVQGPIPPLPPIHPSIDAEVSALVARCFTRDIAQRTITATDCVQVLDRLLARLTGSSASLPAPAPRDDRPPVSVSSEAIATAVRAAPGDGDVTTDDRSPPAVDDDEMATLALGSSGSIPKAAVAASFRPVRKTVRMAAVDAPAPLARTAPDPSAMYGRAPAPAPTLVTAPSPATTVSRSAPRDTRTLWIGIAVALAIGVVVLVVVLASGGKR